MSKFWDNPRFDTPFFHVLHREWNRMISRRLYFGTVIFLPLFCLFFMSTIFGDGQMENIPIGIVDQDQTALSRGLTRDVEAVPIFHVAAHYSNQESARVATQQKKIYGYLVIPSNFEADALSGRGPTLAYYNHYALLSVGDEVKGGFENILRTFSAAPVVLQSAVIGIPQDKTAVFLQPFKQSQHPLFNPDLDYSIYLTVLFFYILLSILVMLTSLYAVGSEIKFGTAIDWLNTAGDNILTAVTAKMLPYTIMYSIIVVFANFIMFGVFQIPQSCGFWALNITGILFVITSEAMAIFIYSCFPVTCIIISIVSMLGSIAFTLCGITFPAISMYPIFHYLGYILPAKHFVLIYQNLLYGDYGFAYSWGNYAALFLFILPTILMLPYLKKCLKKQDFWEAIAC